MATLCREGGTQHTPALAKHEIDFLLRDFLGSDNKVALVLAVFIVNDNDKLTALDLLYSLVDCI